MVNAEFSKQRIHTEGSRFVGNDGDDALAEGLVLHQGTKHSDERHCGRDLHGSFGSSVEVSVGLGGRQVDGLGGHHALGHRTPHRRAALGGVGDQVGDVLWQYVRVGFEIFVGERKAKVGAHELHGVHVSLLLLVGGVSSCKGLPETVALDGSNKNDRRLTFVRRCLCISGVELGEVVPTHIGAKGFEFIVRQMSNECCKSVRVEQFLADGCPVGGHDALLITVNQSIEASCEETLRVPSEEIVPRAAPKHLDDVPTCASEAALEFLDDFRVATNRPVETLKIAVHGHHDVVQTFPTGE